MKVLFYDPFTVFIPTFAAALELVEMHHEQGDDVIFLSCHASMPTCIINKWHDPSFCVRCMSAEDRGFSQLNKRPKTQDFHFLTEEDHKKIATLRTSFKSVEDLKNYRVEGFDLGYATTSTVVSMFRDPNLDTQKYASLIQKVLKNAYTVYLSAQNHLRTEKPDRVYMFNGRLASLRGMFRASQQLNVECHLYERGSNKQKYSLYVNHLPHDIKGRTRRVQNSWKNSVETEEERGKLAKSFFIARKQGKPQGWVSFVGEQDPKSLPEGWQPDKHNITIFNSSEDEFVAIGDQWKMRLFKDQLEGIRFLIKRFEGKNDFHLYLRVHPNLRNVQNQSVQELYQLDSDNFTLIPPESSVSTYQLIESTDKVVTFGSTTGIEATFHGTTSVMLGRSFYEELDVVYAPETRDEALTLLTDKKLPPKPKVKTLPYGYYMKTFGIPYRHYEAETFHKGKFKGKRLWDGFFPAFWGELKKRRGLRVKWIENWYLNRLKRKLG